MTQSLYHLTQRVNVEGGDKGVHAAIGGAVSLQGHAGNGPRLLCTQCVNGEVSRKLRILTKINSKLTLDPHKNKFKI